MQAGRLVFPIIMAGFVLFFFGFILTTPVNEASDAPNTRLVRAQDGDSVLIEFTAYYGETGKGQAFFTTQEERVGSLSVGSTQPQVQEEPVAIHLTANDPALGLRTNLLGHRVGDKYTTPTVPLEDRTLSRTLAELAYEERFDRTTPVGGGRTFNTTEYVAFWQSRGTTLQEGARWECEGAGLWDCEVTTLDTAGNEFAYRRVVEPGETYPVEPIWGTLAVGGDMTWDVSIQEGREADQFIIRLDPPVGTKFQFLQDAGGDFAEGSYVVYALNDANIMAKYTTFTPNEPALIGQPVYFDIEIVQITRP